LEANKSEDGNAVTLKPDDKKASIKLWNKRKVQVMFCLSKCFWKH